MPQGDHQQEFPSAKAFATGAPNFGVRGFHAVRTTSMESFADPAQPSHATSSNGKARGFEAKNKLTEVEEEYMLSKRVDNYFALRSKQERAIKRKINLRDVIKFALACLAVQGLFTSVGVRSRLILPVLGLLALVRAVWNNRAKPRHFLLDSNNFYTVFPVLGQIGIVFDTLKNGGGSSLVQRRIAESRNFTSVELVMFGKPNEYWLMDPLDRKYMLRTNWQNFAKNARNGSGHQESFAEVLGRGIYAVDGDEWYDERKISTHMFSANALRNKMERSFNTHAAQLADLLSANMLGKELNLQDVMGNLTFETICDIAFGIAPGSMASEMRTGHKSEFLVCFDRAHEACALRTILPDPVWKALRYLNLGSEATLRKDYQFLRRYVLDIVRHHKQAAHGGEYSENADDGDLLSLYVKTSKESGKFYMGDESYLVDVILNFMFAGRNDMALLLTNLFKLMTPEVEQRMLEEFTRVVGAENNVGWDHVFQLPYCGAVFNEVLRLYPTTPISTRFVLTDDVLPSGIKVKAGDMVSIPLVAIGRDPNLFENPEAFTPERWMVANKPTNRPDEFVFPVFWGGPRLCLGKDMARLQALNITYALLKRFKFQVLPHSENVVPGPVQFYSQGLPVKVYAREKSA